MPRVANVAPDTDWIAVTEEPLPVGEVLAWVVRPSCGALVTFCGTVRDHSDGRAGVVALEYEAYLEQVEPRLATVASSARARWPTVDRLALLHRVGRLQVGEVSVLVAVSTPHRVESFEAVRFCIDTIKQSVPIWKRETWADGSGWALSARPGRRWMGSTVVLPTSPASATPCYEHEAPPREPPPPVIPVAEARRFVLSSCAPLEPRQTTIGDASGRVLAETVRATGAVPPFATSAMDGYAVRAADTAPPRSA